MTFEQWLNMHSIVWRREARGFNIENEFGEGRYVQLIEGRVMRFIDLDDVRQWVKKNIKTDGFFTADAQEDFKNVVG